MNQFRDRAPCRRRARAAGVVLAAGGLLLAAAAATPSDAGGEKRTNSADKVKVSSTAAKPDASGQQVITMKVTIEKDWYIYGNPVGQELFDANKTEVVIKADGKPVPAKVTYPKAKLKKDETLGDYNVYEGEVAIQAVVDRNQVKGDLEVILRVNSCSAKSGVCLAPGQVTFTVK
jgi:hypothetical protein